VEEQPVGPWSTPGAASGEGEEERQGAAPHERPF
jgi:hypothetical protein